MNKSFCLLKGFVLGLILKVRVENVVVRPVNKFKFIKYYCSFLAQGRDVTFEHNLKKSTTHVNRLILMDVVTDSVLLTKVDFLFSMLLCHPFLRRETNR